MKDISTHLHYLENYPATKIHFTKGYSFSALNAEREFEEQRSNFFRTHERMDDYMETREGLDLMNSGFQEYMFAFADPDNLPWYVSRIVFWISSFLLISWPLRVLIEYKTAFVHVHVHKVFGVNYPDSNGGLISRDMTMESCELEMTIKNNYTMVPSYSEALLMEGDTDERQQQSYGAVTTHGANIPLVHLGNSICVAPGLNSTYISSSWQTTSLSPPCDSNQGTTHDNIQTNGYIPLETEQRQSSACSSTASVPGIRHQRKRRSGKRRRQSHPDPITNQDDKKQIRMVHSATLEPGGNRDLASLPSLGNMLCSAARHVTGNELELNQHKCEASTVMEIHTPGRTQPLHTSSQSRTTSPPAYELALVMRISNPSIVASDHQQAMVRTSGADHDGALPFELMKTPL